MDIQHIVSIHLDEDRVRLEEGAYGVYVIGADGNSAVIPWGMLDAVLVAVDYIAKAHRRGGTGSEVYRCIYCGKDGIPRDSGHYCLQTGQ